MLQTLRNLKGSMIVSSDDANIGEIKDFYFDDERWSIRYLVANMGPWYSERPVLISPYSVKSIEWGGLNVRVNLSREQIELAPTPEEKQPVSRLYEEKYSRYYQLPFYWMAGDVIWPNNIYPTIYGNMMNAAAREFEEDYERDLDEKIACNHLRSYQEVVGHKLHTGEDVFGHVEDMIMDQESFQIKYFIIDTINFFPSPSVLIPQEWITQINWVDKEIHINRSKEDVLHAREYDPSRPINLDLR